MKAIPAHGPRLLAVCVAVPTTLLCHVPTAQALTCAQPGFVAPMDGAMDVPTNARLWCASPFLQGSASGQLTLSDRDAVPREQAADAGVGGGADAAGSELPLELSTLTTRQFDVLVATPQQPLRPHTQYTFSCGGTEQSFTTGASPLEEKPAVPSTANLEVHASNDGWGPSYGAYFPEAGALGTLVVMARSGESEDLKPGPTGNVSAIESYTAHAGGFWFGTGPCAGNLVWPEAGVGANLEVRLGAIDLAGNFSGWSDELTVTLPSELRDSTVISTPAPGDDLADPPAIDHPVSQSLPDPTEPPNPTHSAEWVASDSASPSEKFEPPGLGCALGSSSTQAPWTTVSGLLVLALGGFARSRRRRTR